MICCTRYFSVALIFIFSVCPLWMKAQTINWTFCIGGTNHDYPITVQRTPDGGAVLLAETSSTDFDGTGNKGAVDALVVKMSATGQIQWRHVFGGTLGEHPKYIRQTPDGGYLVLGETNTDDGSMPGFKGTIDIFAFKLNSNGARVWQQCYGGSSVEFLGDIRSYWTPNTLFSTSDEPPFKLLQLTADGGFVFAAETASNNGNVSGAFGSQDIWIVKCSSTGVIQWQRCLGGGGEEFSASVQQTNDGGYMVLGYTKSTNGMIAGPHPGRNAWVVRLNSSGAVLWHKLIGSGHSSDDNIPMTLEKNADGSFFITGRLSRYNPGVEFFEDFWVMRINASGDVIWDKHPGSKSGDALYRVIPTNDGGLLLAGQTGNDGDVVSGFNAVVVKTIFWLVKLNGSGQIQWQKSYPYVESSTIYPCNCFPNLMNVSYTSDGGYLLDFSYKYPSYSSPNGHSICSICQGCYGASGVNYTNYQMRVIRIDPSGNQLWTRCLGPAKVIRNATGFKSIDLSATETLTIGITDVFGNSGTVQGGHGPEPPGYEGINDIYVTCLKTTATSIVPIPADHPLSIYPNPTADLLMIDYKPMFSRNKVSVMVRDVYGRAVLEKSNIKTRESISLKMLPAGVYLVTFRDGNAERTIEILKN